ncbi:DUF3342 domain-containing protein [archaeon]|nr:MAG: DUF3342 domain-containing protein [archaeon]
MSLTVEGVTKDKEYKVPFNPSLTDPNIRSFGGDLASYLTSATSSKGPAASNTSHAIFTSSTPRTDESAAPSSTTATSNPPPQPSSSMFKPSTTPHDTKQKRLSFESYAESDPYWKKPPSAAANASSGDLVVIHVCDENQQITRDFCCHRQTLVENMRYFDRYVYIHIHTAHTSYTDHSILSISHLIQTHSPLI